MLYGHSNTYKLITFWDLFSSLIRNGSVLPNNGIYIFLWWGFNNFKRLLYIQDRSFVISLHCSMNIYNLILIHKTCFSRQKPSPNFGCSSLLWIGFNYRFIMSVSYFLIIKIVSFHYFQYFIHHFFLNRKITFSNGFFLY